MATTGDGMAERIDELHAVMADLTTALEAAAEEADLFSAVCAEAVRVVPDADMASITAIRDGEVETAAYTDVRALTIDRAQYAADEGPCLRAARTGETVRVSIATASELWPEFVAAAKEIGVRSYLAAPLRVDDRLLGAINLFGFGAHGYHEFDTQVLRLYTLSVESVLRTTRRYQRARKLAEELDNAMRSRGVIEQAKGMLMLIHQIDEDTAMRRLITESQNTNTKLRDVAARFVRRMSGRRPGARS